MSVSLLVAAGTGGIEQEIVTRAGGAAALVALIGIALVLPLYLTQRREVKRLERWRELEPERGDETIPGHPDYDAYATAATATAAGRPAPTTGSYATGTRLTPAERVTADRPALSRITAERAAIQSPSFWRRFFARGPRHPLVLSLIGILLAAAAVVAVGLATGTLGEPDSEDGGGKSGSGLDKAAVAVVVLNATETPATADRVAGALEKDGFTNIRAGVTGTSNQTVVLYADGFKRAAKAVAKDLEVAILQPLDRETQATAEDADVVVVAGEDRARD